LYEGEIKKGSYEYIKEGRFGIFKGFGRMIYVQNDDKNKRDFNYVGYLKNPEQCHMYSSGAYYKDGEFVNDGCCEDTAFTNLIDRYEEDGDFIFDIEYC